MCGKRQTRNVQFRFMQNAFRILKPIQKSSKCVSVFRNTGANAFAKIQMPLAYEDKRDLYCTYCTCSTCADNHTIIFYASSSLAVAHGSSQACNLSAAFHVFFRQRTSRCVQNHVRQRAPFFNVCDFDISAPLLFTCTLLIPLFLLNKL